MIAFVEAARGSFIGPVNVKKTHRKLIVFSTLLGVLSVTSALLLALAPAPLAPDAANTLFAVDQPSSMDAVFVTKAPIAAGRWKYIYIHHSQTPTGADKIDPGCISISVVGDLDQTVPTRTQIRRLTELVAALQSQLHIGGNEVLLIDSPHSAAGIGRYFPRGAFREQLLP